MTSKSFNSLTGYSAGIPPVQVVDANGNVVTNVLTTGNVTANVMYAGTYRFANGQPLSINAGGLNTQLQYNNNGAFNGIPNVTFNGNTLSLGQVANLSILGGENGYFLQTDGTGNLTWSPSGNGGGSGNGVPGGANSQVQFNDSGSFGGNSGFTFNKTTGVLSTIQIQSNNIVGNVIASNYFIGDGSNISNITNLGTLSSLTVSGPVNLGSVSNLNISGGFSGYVLTTDGAGHLSWQGAGGGGSSPGGANLSFQYNNNGNFAGTSTMSYNPNDGSISVRGTINANIVTANNTSTYGNANVTGNVNAQYFVGNGSFLTGIQTAYAQYVTQSDQPNINSVGTLNSLQVSGNVLSAGIISGAGFQTSGNANIGTVNVSGNLNTTTINVSGNANFSTSRNVNLGNIANIHISGGLNGYVLQTDGLGNLSWGAVGGGSGNSVPGGANTQIQYNANGNLAASPYFTFDYANNVVQVGGELIANVLQLGSGAYKFGTSFVYFATTSSTVSTVLYSIPVSQCSGVNFEIIGTDSVTSKRQSTKISSLYYDGIVQYTEYGSVYINGGVGEFSVTYNPGNVITSPSLDLSVISDTSDPVVYKMLITVLGP